MAGTDAIGRTSQAVVQESQGKKAQGPIPATEGKPGGQVTEGPAVPVDELRHKCPFPPRPQLPPDRPVPIVVHFEGDPEEAGWELYNSVLNSSGADRLKAYQEFTDKIQTASTAALKVALRHIDDRLEWRTWFGIDPERGVLELLRQDITRELRTRPKDPKEEARERIEEVVEEDREVLDREGTRQLEAFVKFVDGLKTPTRAVLEELRDQLVDRMANESDRAMRLIYKLMLHAVNKKMDNRLLGPGPIGFPGHQLPEQFPPPSPAPLKLSQEESGLLKSKLGAANAGTQAAVKAFAGIKD